jgi:hypothetical protein
MKRSPALTMLWTMLLTSGAVAQTSQEDRCAAALAVLNPRPTPRATCPTLAAFLVDTITTPYYKQDDNTRIPPRDVQSSRAGDAVPTGSPAQAEAVPGVQPTSLAAVTVAATGSDGGTQTLTSLSINPTLLFGPDDTHSLARWSRFTDLTISFPVSDIEGAGGALDYLGLRARVNLTAAAAGDAVFNGVLAAYKEVLEGEGLLVARITRVLREASDVEQCARSILASSLGDQPEGCNADFRIDLAPSAYRQLKESIARAREKADAKYLGLDLRFDTGDPTLGAVPGTDLQSLEVGVAWGRRFLKPKLRDLLIGVRSRLGMRYVDPVSTGQDVEWAVTGGIGLEGSRLMGLEQTARFTLGFEFDYANSPAAQREALGTDFLALRSSLSIPLVGSASLAVGVNVPIVGPESPSLSFNLGGGLLMSALAGELTGRSSPSP